MFTLFQSSGQAMYINTATGLYPDVRLRIEREYRCYATSEVTPSAMSYVGTFTNNTSNVNVTPTKISPISDPCSTVSGCAYLTATPPASGSCVATTTYNTVNVTIQPGTYCSTLTATTCNITFAPGIYIMKNGLNLNNGVVNGTGVTIYNLAGAVTITGSNDDLTAPTTGNTAGVVIYQKKSDTTAFNLSGNTGGTGLAGMLYFPGATMNISGGVANWPFLVGNVVNISGSGLYITNSSFPGAATGRAALAE